ncbi:MAG: VanZ family protein [Cetobacterium sp.]
MRRESIFKVSSVAIMLLIFWFSHQNGEESLKQSNFILQYVKDLLEIFNLDVRKLAHFTVYLLLGSSYFLSYENLTLENAMKAVCLKFLYACSDEFHQSFVPSRGPSFRDVLIDTSGSIIGISSILMYLEMKNREYLLQK